MENVKCCIYSVDNSAPRVFLNTEPYKNTKLYFPYNWEIFIISIVFDIMLKCVYDIFASEHRSWRTSGDRNCNVIYIATGAECRT